KVGQILCKTVQNVKIFAKPIECDAVLLTEVLEELQNLFSSEGLVRELRVKGVEEYDRNAGWNAGVLRKPVCEGIGRERGLRLISAQIRFCRQELNFLRTLVIEQDEVVLGKSGNGAAVLVVDDDVDLDEVCGHADRRHVARGSC